MGLMQEFKDFAVKGNAIDLAVGVVIGAAFGKIVTSIVNDVIMPLVGFLTGGHNFAGRFIALDGKDYATQADAIAAKAPVIGYGNLIQEIVNFLIIAFCIFIVIRQLNRLTKSAPAK